MKDQFRVDKKADSLVAPVQNQFQSRPCANEAQLNSGLPRTQQDVENKAFQEDKYEATGLEIQAKDGTISSEGQERLTVLQAKMSNLLQARVEQASRFGHNFANVSVTSDQGFTPHPIQPKLTIGQPGDKYEQEADQMAQQVVSQINAPAPQHSDQGQQGQTVQRQEAPEEEELAQTKPLANSLQRQESHEDEEVAQKKPLTDTLQRQESQEDELAQTKPLLQRKSDGGGTAATPNLEASIHQAQGGGQALSDNIRKPMERAFGADFSGVKVHTDNQSDQLNQSIQAKAFTTGQDIFFRQGAYDPGSRGGQELLAHELTHVVQQNGGAVQRASQTRSTGQALQPATSLEQDGSREKELAASRQSVGESKVSQKNTTELSTQLQRFGGGDLAYKRSLAGDLYYQYQIRISEEQAMHLENAGVTTSLFMMHYQNGLSVKDMVRIAEFALNRGGQTALDVTKYLFNAKLLLGASPEFTKENMTLLSSLWKDLKVVATKHLVGLVVNCAADNPLRGLLYALLKEGIALEAISSDLLNHLKPFSSRLLNDAQTLHRAYTVASDRPEDLAKLEEWGFDRANYEAAQSHAEAAKQKHLSEGMTKIETSEKTKQNQALSNKLEDAKKKLFPNENKRKKAFPPQPPTFGIDEYNKNQQKLKSKQEELAAEDFAAFAQERLVEESQLNSDAEQVSTTDLQKYKSYLATVNYHKKAPIALKFAQDNFNDATTIALAMQQAPAIETIVEGNQLSKDALISCIDILGAKNLVMIPTPTLKQFAEQQRRLELLRQMQADNINVVKIQGLVNEFGTFDKYCDPGSVPHLSRLLSNYTVAEIKNLLSASLNATVEGQRMAFLVNIMQYAQSATDMVNFLKLAKMVSEKCINEGLADQWKANAIELALQANGRPGMDEKALKKLIVTNVLTGINKQAYFSNWIDVLNVLIKEDLATIDKGSDWYALPGDGTTRAIEYEVKAKEGGAVLEHFVAHWHPGATKATTSNPNASKKHLKPIHGNKDTQRVYEGGVPKPLEDKLLWGTH
jgi:hypothetical protein